MATVPGPSAGPSAASQAPGVAVWEWQDETGHWRPYQSAVCSYVEQSFQALLLKGCQASGTWPVNGSIPLGQADSALAPYVIDIPSLTQFRQDTGTMRAVHRHVFPLNSAAGQGVVWEWQNDEGGWFPYEMNIVVYLEQAFMANCPQVDLGHFGYNYGVNFVAQTQTNQTTGYQRKVRRQVDSPYPVATVVGPPHTRPTCSCQQCLLNSGTGPITSQYRHSMVNLPGSSGTQGAGRTVGLSASATGFVPYNKPTLTGARSMPRLNVHSGGTLLLPVPVGGPSMAHAATRGTSVPKLPVSVPRPGKLNQALAGMMALLMLAAGFPVHLTPAPCPTRASKKHTSTKEGRRGHAKGGASSPEDVVKKYFEELKTPPADEDCIICMEKLAAPSGYSDTCESKTIRPESFGRLAKCGHTLHLLCVLAMYSSGNKDGSLQCPSCKTIYGEKTGTQPSGKMDVSTLPESLPGHAGCGSIQIVYYINKGIQGPEHPSPGAPYTARGFPRYCYLPDNEKGRKVLELLKVAWKRRLIFTVGTSTTTGESNTVVWNEIHHKTEMNSNVSGHGYPDPNYLDNVLAELAAQGVTEDCLRP